jgi:N-acetyltransferase 10
MLRPIKTGDQSVELPEQIKKFAAEGADLEEQWASAYTVDFRKRLINLLGYEFRQLPCALALQLANPQIKVSAQSGEDLQEDANAINSIKKEDLERFVSVFDLKRLESYSKNLVDFHLIMDLVPTLAKLYFNHSAILPRSAVQLSYTQSAILLGVGLQFKSVEDLQVDLNLQANQLLPLFNKGIRKFTRVFREVFERHIA